MNADVPTAKKMHPQIVFCTALKSLKINTQRHPQLLIRVES